MAKRRSVDDEFEEIGNRALTEAAKVDASVMQYQDGLKTIIHLCQAALQASKEMDRDKETDD